ncbi:sensor histidine kinase [Nonomuraea ferruginea]
MLTDPATWRDGFWLLLDPGVKMVLLPLLILLPGRGLRVYGLWCELLLAATASSRMVSQLSSLNRARNLAVDTQAAEMRRIERDLHDGTQARLVALGMTIGAAEQLMESDPKAARALMAKAREASAETLTELRRVIRGIHPPVLAERGLGDAVRALAMDSALKVSVQVELTHRPEAPVEAAAYFAVSELLSNAARHGGAESVEIDISTSGANLRITVTDDGWGGADPSKGSGLTGIEQPAGGLRRRDGDPQPGGRADDGDPGAAEGAARALGRRRGQVASLEVGHRDRPVRDGLVPAVPTGRRGGHLQTGRLRREGLVPRAAPARCVAVALHRFHDPARYGHVRDRGRHPGPPQGPPLGAPQPA